MQLKINGLVSKAKAAIHKPSSEINTTQTVFTTEKINTITDRMANGYTVARKDNPWLDGDKIGVRRSGIVFAQTPEEQQEYLKCALGEAADGLPYVDPSTQKLDIKGIYYFINNYCQTKREDGSFGAIELRDYQFDVVDLYNDNRFSLLCMSRQMGKCLFCLDRLEIGPGKYVPIYKLWFKYKKNKDFYDYLKFVIYYFLDILS